MTRVGGGGAFALLQLQVSDQVSQVFDRVAVGAAFGAAQQALQLVSELCQPLDARGGVHCGECWWRRSGWLSSSPMDSAIVAQRQATFTGGMDQAVSGVARVCAQ